MNLVIRLNEIAKEKGSNVACCYMEKSYTYAELNELIMKFASGLEKLGVKQGDHIALLLRNSPQFIISLYGALCLGGVVIPINPDYTQEEIHYILSNGDVKAVIGLESIIPMMALPEVEHLIIVDTLQNETLKGNNFDHSLAYFNSKPFSEVVSSGDIHYRVPKLKNDDTAIILYTSGTTGKPKGAMLTHQNLFSNARDISAYLKMNEKDRMIATLPMFHVFCLTVALNAPLMSGATVLIVPKFSPKEIFQLAKRYQATIFAGVPTMYNFLFQYPDGDPLDFQSLRLCASGGASMPVTLLKNFEKKFNVAITEGYGLSEASPATCFNPLDLPRKPGSIGTSIPNVENKIVNELGEEVPIGEVGELIVRGPNVMKGYYKMPEETDASIRDGWLFTGDLARMDEDGYFYIVDRKKEMIIVGGYNVYPREVEEVFYGHPDIVEAAVIGVPDSEYGELVKSYVVSKNPELTEKELREYCSMQLADYKVPASIEFITELPKNTTGKILRRALKAEFMKK